MSNAVGLAIFALGIVLLISGFSASQSISAEFSRFFSGHLADKTLWMLAGGGVAAIAGLVLALRDTHDF